MKKIFMLIMAFAMIVNTSNAAFTESKTEKKEQLGAFKSVEQKAAAEMFVKLTRKEYENLTGKHLSAVDRLLFKMTQNHVKRELKRAGGTEGFNLGGFLLGFFLGLIGVLLAYIFSSNPNFRKWTWIGLGVAIIITLLIFAL